MQMSVNNTTGEIEWTWRDRLPYIVLAVVTFAALLLTLSACGPHTARTVPNPTPVAAPVAPAVPAPLNALPDGADDPSMPPDNTAVPAPCADDRLNAKGRALCAEAWKVPAYGWTNPDGSQCTDPGGPMDVKDVMSDTELSAEELPFVLQGVIDGYNEYGGQIHV